MTELKLTLIEDSKISCEMEGEIADISVMICKAMLGNKEVAAMFMGAIPTFLDESGIDRSAFCQQLMNSVGSKGEQQNQKRTDIN